ncbi:TPA: phage tail protein [Klebsiella pneumoniae]|jgi:phage-related tail fiber protein|uniref:phage tail-collar fiber domain-containing protein n=1 Tax=Enterobacteriaceae TaxID=543 RepID=UPI00090C9A18|nr:MULTISPECIES: phage tail protein [Enterobacteriaceae]MDU1915114.1 phage tail protein [Clostridium perfringens]DAI77947.1 MAG TPA: tail collar fiber protein [Caudoviricetes sp.]HDX8822849.1 phage tail protein [Klebsiella michiganensis]API48528.1 phage tail protein [Escherichia coli]EEZ6918496.1 phage tail protein [Escherichia coli]
MTAKYFAILTNQGAARLANAAALGTKLNLTQMAVGDANGTLPTPDPAQTKLINQKRIAPLNLLTVDPANTSQIIAEQIIPENEGGFWIREIGLYDDDGILIAVANCPETYKPQLQEGSGRTQTIRMILIVSSTSAITLKIDPSVVLATRQYVDDKVIEVKSYADSLLAAHLADADPHPQYLKITDIAKYTPVGVPLPYPSATPPTGWLKCNGAVFDKVKYPGLAAVFPSGNLPDLRGEFIRGWDDSRGIDNGRALLSSQGHSLRDHSHNQQVWTGSNTTSSTIGQAGSYAPLATGGDGGIAYTDREPQSLPSAVRAIGTRGVASDNAANIGTETRPRNIAFNYIVRAA